MHMKIWSSKKSQASMEFLMSYGWIIIVALVAVGGLYSFGVLDLKKFLPEECITGYLTPCIDYRATKSTLTIVLGNNLDQPILIRSLKATGCKGEASGMIESGKRTVFAITNCSVLEKNFNGEITGVYDKGDGLTHKLTGKLIAWVEEDGEVCLNCSQQPEIKIIGEAGSIATSNFQWKYVTFSKTYNAIPIILATPASQNSDALNDNNSLIAVLKDINVHGFNATLCRDNGTVLCDKLANNEILHWIAIDTEAIQELEWIAAGKTGLIKPNGKNNAVNWGKTLRQKPYVFATPQTYSQAGKIGATVWVDGDAVSNTGTTKLIPCTHQGVGNSCDTNSTREELGWVAIDVSNKTIVALQSGQAQISNSKWAHATLNTGFSNPIIAVLANDDNGAQDPKNPWARKVTSTGMDFRYCEQKGFDVCDNHNAENVVWIAVEQGDLIVD